MTRNRQSAKAAGQRWETAICGSLIDNGWPYAERRRLNGIHDRGDVSGIPGLVIEAKDRRVLDIAGAVDEANREATNDGARYGVAWLKRAGKASPLNGYVVMDGATFLRLLREAGL